MKSVVLFAGLLFWIGLSVGVWMPAVLRTFRALTVLLS